MDLLSHALLGAGAAIAIARPQEMRKAALVAAGAALLPDTDAFIRSTTDPLLYIEYHRAFTHALIFIPIGALLATMLLWPWLRRQLSFGRCYLFAFIGYALHAPLDAATSYGTHLLWPFSDARTAGSIISVVDPLFTLILAGGVGWALWRRGPAASRVALVLAGLYLSLGAFQHHRALQAAADLNAQRGIEAARLLVKPTFGNLLLWRSITVTNDHIQVDAIRPGWFGPGRTYAGEAAPRLHPQDLTSLPPDSQMAADVDRFAFFTDDLLVHTPGEPWTFGDARYGMLPTSIRSIWRIEVDPQQPDAHVNLVTDRDMSPAERQAYMDMMMGRPTATAPQGQ